MKAILLAGLVFLLLLSPAAKAQGVGASGQIKGTVYDPSGSVIPGAAVEAVDTAKGTHYTAASDSSGQYQFPNLPPSTYELTSRYAGLQTQAHKGLQLQVGETVILDFHLQLASATAQVEVLEELPVVETQRGSQSDTLTQEDISSLPIDR